MSSEFLTSVDPIGKTFARCSKQIAHSENDVNVVRTMEHANLLPEFMSQMSSPTNSQQFQQFQQQLTVPPFCGASHQQLLNFKETIQAAHKSLLHDGNYHGAKAIDAQQQQSFPFPSPILSTTTSGIVDVDKQLSPTMMFQLV